MTRPAAADGVRRRQASPFDQVRRARWPQLRADVVAVVFLGGCLGGWARYAITTAWTTPTDRFPWSTLAVNVAGAFLLGLVVVVAADLAPSRYLRPLVGTGFCGALTTFSSVVVAADRLLAHHAVGIALGYLLATIGAGLAAAWSGVVLARAVVAAKRPRKGSTG